MPVRDGVQRRGVRRLAADVARRHACRARARAARRAPQPRDGRGGCHPLLDDDGTRPNPELVSLWARGVAAAARYGRFPSGRPGGRGGNRAPGRPRRGATNIVYTPTRVEVVEVLEREEMLPAIVFIFSRAGCDEAVEACVRADLEPDVVRREQERIREFAQMRAATIDADDLRALAVRQRSMDGLERGIAAHHAGMLPDLQGDGRGALRARPRQARLRDRDALPRHQHAGAKRRDRAADEVHRREARAPHPDRLHAAHRTRRTSRHRRDRLRRHAVHPVGLARQALVTRDGQGLQAHVVVPAVLQHGRQPRPQLRPRHRGTPAQLVVRAVRHRPQRRAVGTRPRRSQS